MDGEWLDDKAYQEWLQGPKVVGLFPSASGVVICEKVISPRGLTDVRISVKIKSPKAAGEGAVKNTLPVVL